MCFKFLSPSRTPDVSNSIGVFWAVAPSLLSPWSQYTLNCNAEQGRIGDEQGDAAMKAKGYFANFTGFVTRKNSNIYRITLVSSQHFHAYLEIWYPDTWISRHFRLAKYLDTS